MKEKELVEQICDHFDITPDVEDYQRWWVGALRILLEEGPKGNWLEEIHDWGCECADAEE